MDHTIHCDCQYEARPTPFVPGGFAWYGVGRKKNVPIYKLRAEFVCFSFYLLIPEQLSRCIGSCTAIRGDSIDPLRAIHNGRLRFSSLATTALTLSPAYQRRRSGVVLLRRFSQARHMATPR